MMVKGTEEKEKVGVKKVSGPKPKSEEGKEEAKAARFIVMPLTAAVGVTATDERDAVKQAVAKNSGTGKFIVVDADFVEVISAWHRIETKKDSADSLFSE